MTVYKIIRIAGGDFRNNESRSQFVSEGRPGRRPAEEKAATPVLLRAHAAVKVPRYALRLFSQTPAAGLPGGHAQAPGPARRIRLLGGRKPDGRR